MFESVGVTSEVSRGTCGNCTLHLTSQVLILFASPLLQDMLVNHLEKMASDGHLEYQQSQAPEEYTNNVVG